MMGSKFKVGDRVRCVDSKETGLVAVGKEYTLTEVGDEYVYAEWDGGRTAGMWPSRFILLPGPTLTTGKHYRTRSGKVTGRVEVDGIGFSALIDGSIRNFDKAGSHVFGKPEFDIVEEWVPKVGDRVSYKDYQVSGEGIIHSTVTDSDIVSYDWNVTVNDADKKWAYYVNETCRRFKTASLKPLPQPATLTIEAGRYYKTRDGRKVGPMRQRDGFLDASGWHYNSTGECCYLGKSGQDVHTELDLVALWPEPTTTSTTAPVSAQVDAIADEYGSGGWGEWSEPKDYAPKFKVGDRVVSLEDGPTKGMVGDLVEFDSDDGLWLARFSNFSGGHGKDCEEWWVRPSEIRALTEKGKSLTATSTDFTITISGDATAFDAEIDRVKRRLKKLAKRAKKLGISLEYDLRDAA